MVHVLRTTQNSVISRCCLAEDGKEMYQELKRTCTAIVLLINSFVQWCSRCRCRRGFVNSLLTKKSAASGDERAGNGRTIESKRSCRKSLLASHSVMEMCRSRFINTKYKCLKCEMPACNKCSVFKQNEDVEGWTAGKRVAYSCILRGFWQGPKVLSRWRR